MGIGNKQIGWSNESNLLWDISNQLDRLTKVIAANTGGGGGTNPTSTFMPFNNAGTFADSFLVNDVINGVLKSVYSGNDIGLKLDFQYNNYILGNIEIGNNGFLVSPNSCIIGDAFGNTNTTLLSVNDNNSIINTSYQGNENGLMLNFANKIYKFGDNTDIEGFNCYYKIDADNFTIETICSQFNDDDHDFINIFHSRYNYFINLRNDIGGAGDEEIDYKAFETNVNSATFLRSAVWDNNYSYSQITTQLTLTYRNDNDNSYRKAYNFLNVPTFNDNDDALGFGMQPGDIYILNDLLPSGAPRHLCIVY